LGQLWYYIFSHHFSLFIDLADGKKTSTHLGKNRLDKERTKMLLICVVSYFLWLHCNLRTQLTVQWHIKG